MGVKIRNVTLKLFCIVLCWALLLTPCVYFVLREFNAPVAQSEPMGNVPVFSYPEPVVGTEAADVIENSNDDLPNQDIYENADLVVSVPADKNLMSVVTPDINAAAGQAPDLYVPPVVVVPDVPEEEDDSSVSDTIVEDDSSVEAPVEDDSSVVEDEPETDSDINDYGSEGFYDTYALLKQPDGSMFIYYDQTWEAYADHPYGVNTIGGYGCGPTSMAMVVSNLTDTVITPDQMGDWAYDNGYFVNYCGTAYGLFPAASAAYGINCVTASAYDKETIVSALKAGKLVLTIVGPGDFTIGRHFLLIRGITDDGKLLLGDSGKYEFALEPWDYNRIINQLSGGTCWIFG